MIKVIIFDFGEVIGYRKSSFRKELEKNIGKKIKSFKLKQEVIDKFIIGKINEDQFWEMIKIRPKKSYKNFFLKEYEKNVRIKKGMLKILKSLKKKGYNLVLASNLIKPQSLFLKKKLSKYFSLLIFSCEIGTQKPYKKFYSTVLKRLNVRGEECLFIDNEEENIKTAKLFGMKTILFKNTKQLKEELKKFLP